MQANKNGSNICIECKFISTKEKNQYITIIQTPTRSRQYGIGFIIVAGEIQKPMGVIYRSDLIVSIRYQQVNKQYM